MHNLDRGDIMGAAPELTRRDLNVVEKIREVDKNCEKPIPEERDEEMQSVKLNLELLQKFLSDFLDLADIVEKSQNRAMPKLKDKLKRKLKNAQTNVRAQLENEPIDTVWYKAKASLEAARPEVEVNKPYIQARKKEVEIIIKSITRLGNIFHNKIDPIIFDLTRPKGTRRKVRTATEKHSPPPFWQFWRR